MPNGVAGGERDAPCQEESWAPQDSWADVSAFLAAGAADGAGYISSSGSSTRDSVGAVPLQRWSTVTTTNSRLPQSGSPPRAPPVAAPAHLTAPRPAKVLLLPRIVRYVKPPPPVAGIYPQASTHSVGSSSRSAPSHRGRSPSPPPEHRQRRSAAGRRLRLVGHRVPEAGLPGPGPSADRQGYLEAPRAAYYMDPSAGPASPVDATGRGTVQEWDRDERARTGAGGPQRVWIDAGARPRQQEPARRRRATPQGLCIRGQISAPLIRDDSFAANRRLLAPVFQRPPPHSPLRAAADGAALRARADGPGPVLHSMEVEFTGPDAAAGRETSPDGGAPPPAPVHRAGGGWAVPGADSGADSSPERERERTGGMGDRSMSDLSLQEATTPGAYEHNAPHVPHHLRWGSRAAAGDSAPPVPGSAWDTQEGTETRHAMFQGSTGTPVRAGRYGSPPSRGMEDDVLGPLAVTAARNAIPQRRESHADAGGQPLRSAMKMEKQPFLNLEGPAPTPSLRKQIMKSSVLKVVLPKVKPAIARWRLARHKVKLLMIRVKGLLAQGAGMEQASIENVLAAFRVASASAMLHGGSGATTELAPEDVHSVSYHKQGNLEYYSEDKVRKRLSMMHSAAISAAIDVWWNVLPKTFIGGEELVNEAQYTIMNVKIQLALIEDPDPLEMEESAKEDWLEDASGAPFITEEKFHYAMFQLADLWVDSVVTKEYVQRPDHLIQHLTMEAIAKFVDPSHGRLTMQAQSRRSMSARKSQAQARKSGHFPRDNSYGNFSDGFADSLNSVSGKKWISGAVDSDDAEYLAYLRQMRDSAAAAAARSAEAAILSGAIKHLTAEQIDSIQRRKERERDVLLELRERRKASRKYLDSVGKTNYAGLIDGPAPQEWSDAALLFELAEEDLFDFEKHQQGLSPFDIAKVNPRVADWVRRNVGRLAAKNVGAEDSLPEAIRAEIAAAFSAFDYRGGFGMGGGADGAVGAAGGGGAGGAGGASPPRGGVGAAQRGFYETRGGGDSEWVGKGGPSLSLKWMRRAKKNGNNSPGKERGDGRSPPRDANGQPLSPGRGGQPSPGPPSSGPPGAAFIGPIAQGLGVNSTWQASAALHASASDRLAVTSGGGGGGGGAAWAQAAPGGSHHGGGGTFCGPGGHPGEFHYDRWARQSMYGVAAQGDGDGRSPTGGGGSGQQEGPAGWSLPRLPGMPGKNGTTPGAPEHAPQPFYLKNDVSGGPSRGSPQKGRPRAGSGGPYHRSARGEKGGGTGGDGAWRETLAHSGEVASLLRKGRERVQKQELLQQQQQQPQGGNAGAAGRGGRDTGALVNDQRWPRDGPRDNSGADDRGEAFGAWRTTRTPAAEEQHHLLVENKWAGSYWGSVAMGLDGASAAY